MRPGSVCWPMGANISCDRFAERFVRAAVPYDNQQWQTGLSHGWRIGIPQIFPTWSLLALRVDKEGKCVPHEYGRHAGGSV